MNHIKLIEKGTTVYVYEMDNFKEQYLNIIELTLGEDILKSDSKYVNYNGTLIVSEQEVEDAVREHMKIDYPKVRDYVFEIDEK